jgi:hypothetical protein
VHSVYRNDLPEVDEPVKQNKESENGQDNNVELTPPAVNNGSLRVEIQEGGYDRMHLNIESLLEIQKNYYDPEEHKTVEEY